MYKKREWKLKTKNSQLKYINGIVLLPEKKIFFKYRFRVMQNVSIIHVTNFYDEKTSKGQMINETG